jgi:cytochrome c nitrite reductase small subunit
MQPQYDAWQKSSHRQVAVCVDCHLPHAFVPKYLAKTENGWRHGKLFTTQGFKEPIELHPTGERILQDNCVRCHDALVSMSHGSEIGRRTSRQDERLINELPCVHCHSGVGHGERAALGGPLGKASSTDSIGKGHDQ